MDLFSFFVSVFVISSSRQLFFAPFLGALAAIHYRCSLFFFFLILSFLFFYRVHFNATSCCCSFSKSLRLFPFFFFCCCCCLSSAWFISLMCFQKTIDLYGTFLQFPRTCTAQKAIIIIIMN